MISSKSLNIKNLIVSILLAVTLCFLSIITLPIRYAKASVGYSDVLEDLRLSENFDESNYPAVDNDYSVKLITIAESDYNELFLYVYQPSAQKTAFTCIKVSIHLGFSPDGQNLNPTIYNLKLVSNNGVFYKYVVENLEPTKEEGTHYFNIVALYRNSNSLLEESIQGGTTDGKAFNVGEQWCCYAKDGVMYYEKATFETVEMTPTMNGSINLKDGSFLNSVLGVSAGRKVMFLAFNVENYDVKHIYDANLSYEYRYVKKAVLDASPDIFNQYPITSYQYSSDGENWKNANEEGATAYYPKNIKLTDKETRSYKGTGLFSKEYTWKSIYSSSDLLKDYSEQDIEFVGGTYDILKNSQYIFCYADYGYNHGSSSSTTPGNQPVTYTTTWNSYVEYKAVSVLTLHFLDAVKGELNLGVVCDITTADDVDDGIGNGFKSLEDLFGESFKLFSMLILGLGLIIILWPFISTPIIWLFKTVFKGFGFIIKWVFKIAFFILLFPWNVIFKKRKRK